MRYINQPIEVTTEPDEDAPYPLGRPTEFYWPAHDRTYKVIENAHEPWAEARHWWTPEELDLPPEAPGDRWYYQVYAKSNQGGGVVTIELDPARGTWTLISFED
ncbi:DUF6504 family protein [Nonomuraea sp. NPDC059023]|uniref:DUF6504 family protein n=1 Tax=unclassified Nonomuraea TaxID=2593643 RepID=UPI0036B9B33D